MFPAPQSVLQEKDFAQIRTYDPHYADLLQMEFIYCKANEADIISKAQRIYAIGCDKIHKLNRTCCDFILLEEKMNDYGKVLEFSH
jgi:hypothetical protein